MVHEIKFHHSDLGSAAGASGHCEYDGYTNHAVHLVLCIKLLDSLDSNIDCAVAMLKAIN